MISALVRRLAARVLPAQKEDALSEYVNETVIDERTGEPIVRLGRRGGPYVYLPPLSED